MENVVLCVHVLQPEIDDLHESLQNLPLLALLLRILFYDLGFQCIITGLSAYFALMIIIIIII
jgi:hypothetical protein